MTDRVTIDVDGNVAIVTLNRPAKMNAVDHGMFAALRGAADEISSNRAIRAVVMQAAGDNFCAGIDVSAFASGDLDFGEALAKRIEPSAANFFQRAAYAWRELPIPVVCAIRGVAFGAGLQIALGADVRFASADARFSIMEAKWGIIPDMGISGTLRGLVPADKVKELAWTARIVDSEEALQIGLVTGVAEDPEEKARALADACAARSPDAVRGIKRLVNEGWQVLEEDALALEAELQSKIIGGENQREAIAANIEGREPNFSD